MKFIIQDERLGYVEELFRKIAQTYTGMLRESFLFSAKLNALTVRADYEADDQACGEFCTFADRNEFEIRLHLSEDETQAAYIMGHELAHCLMDSVGIGRDCAAHDKSMPLNSQIHRMDADGVDFGFGMEEALAELIGMEAACRTPGVDAAALHSGEEEERPELEAVSALAECFGNPLGSLSQLDEVRRFGKKVSFRTPYSPFDETEVTAVGEECGNDFWAMVVNHSFPEIMRRCDALMCEGAFRKLCGVLDAHCRCSRSQSEGNAEEKLIISMLMKNFMEEVRRFGESYAAVEEKWSEKKEAEESLREAAARLKQRCRAFEEAYQEDKARAETLAQLNASFSVLLDAFEKAGEYAAAVAEIGAQLDGADVFDALKRASESFEQLMRTPAPPLTAVEDHIPVMRGIFASAMEVVRYYDEHPLSE